MASGSSGMWICCPGTGGRRGVSPLSGTLYAVALRVGRHTWVYVATPSRHHDGRECGQSLRPALSPPFKIRESRKSVCERGLGNFSRYTVDLAASVQHLPVWQIFKNRLVTPKQSKVVCHTTYHTPQAPTIKILRTITPPPFRSNR